MCIAIKKPQALKRMRIAGQIVAEAFALLGENIKPGR